MPDDFKKVRAGQPLEIPAHTYNRFIDVARAHGESEHPFRRSAKQNIPQSEIVAAKNMSGEAAPWWGICKITAGAVENRLLQFGKPDGSGPYGVCIEPIANNAIGRVALSGGMWRIKVSGDVAVGDSLRPVSGQWYANTAGDNYAEIGFQAFSTDQDGQCLAQFFSGPTGASVVLKALSDMPLDNVLYGAAYVDPGGAVGDTVTVYRPPGIYIEKDQIGILAEAQGGQDIFIPANMREVQQMPFTVETRTADPAYVAGDLGRMWLRTDLT